MNILITFIIANIANVIIQTAKSLITIKGNKFSAALINALAYGFYTYIVVLMVCDELPLWARALIVGLCNLIGVYVVKWIEEKKQKEKLWKIELTTSAENANILSDLLSSYKISHNHFTVDKWEIFNIFTATKQQSHYVKELAKQYGAKCFASETKYL